MSDNRCRQCKHFYEERGGYAPMDECGMWECEFEAKDQEEEGEEE